MGCWGVSQRLRGGGLSETGGAEPAEPGAEPVAAAVPPGEVGGGVAEETEPGSWLRAGVAEGPGAEPPHPISHRARANQILAILGEFVAVPGEPGTERNLLPMGDRRGAALMTALMVTMFLFVLSLAVLSYLERDSRASLQLRRTQQALANAQAGLFYVRAQMIEGGSVGVLVDGTHRMYDLDSTGLDAFEVWLESDSGQTVHSLGLVRSASGNVLARRELASPSHTGSWYGFSPTTLIMTARDVDL